jgi:hypothetical protein
MGTDATAQANRDRLGATSVGSGPGLSIPAARTRPPAPSPMLPDGRTNPAYKDWVNAGLTQKYQQSNSDTGQPASEPTKKIPVASTFAQDVAARKAQLNPFAQPAVKENRHNAVNRLARKFENYIENKFGLVENNYIPKKKSLK